MNELATKILAAHTVATLKMQEALAEYKATLEKPGNEKLKENAIRMCGSWDNVEPFYCGFAWVIIPAKENPGFNAAVKEAIKSLGYKHDAAGNLLTLDGKFATGAVPASVRDLGSRTGYTTKGQCEKNDWSFHGPGEHRGQSMDIKAVGARAFAEALMADGTVVGARVFTRGD